MWVRDQVQSLQADVFEEALSQNAAWQTISSTRWWSEYRGRELDFARDVLGMRHQDTGALKLWEAQRYICEALFKYRFVNVRSCRTSGKSHLAGGVIVPTFLYTAPSKILVIAPTLAQVRDVMFAHTARTFHESATRLPGKLGVRTLRLDEEHFAIGIPSRNPDNIRGHHAGVIVPGDPDADAPPEEQLQEIIESSMATRLLVIIDEPQGIDEPIFRVLRGMYNKPNVYVLMQGNPTLGIDDDHEYVRASQPGSRWHNVRISAVHDSEVVERGGTTDPLPADKTFWHVPTYLIQREWIDEQFRDYELDDPFVLADVLGRFATGSTTSLVIPRTILEAALASRHTHKIGAKIGVDIGKTHDSCVAVLMYHGEVCSMEEWRPGADDHQAMVSVADKILALSVHWGLELNKAYDDYDGRPIEGRRISIDDTGMSGVCDILHSRGLPVDRVQFGGRARGDWVEVVGPQRYQDTRSEMHWVARRLLQEGIVRVPMKYRRIWQQCQWAHYERKLDLKGDMIKIEPKDDIRERHGRSPDNADAFVLACREPRGPLFSSLPDRATEAAARRSRRGFRRNGSWHRIG